MKLWNKFFLIACLCLIFAAIGYAEPLTLEQSVDEALQFSPTIVAAQNELDAARSQLSQAFSALLPNIKVEGAFGQSYSEPMTVTIPSFGAFSIMPNETANVGSYSFSLTQPIFVGGKLLQAYSIANASFQIAKENLRKAQDEAVFDATNGYFQVLKADKIVKLIGQEIANTKKYLSQVQNLYNNGIATKADLLRVEAELSSLRQNEIGFKSALNLSKLNFNSMLGRKLNSSVELVEPESLTFASPELVDVNTLLKTAYQMRPEWRSLLQTKKIAEAGVGLAWGDFFPSVAVTGSAGRTMTEYPSKGRYDLGNWKAMVVGSWTLFDGFNNVSKVSESRFTLAAVKARETSVRDAIELEINSVVAQLQANEEQVAVAIISAKLAQESYEYAKLSYESQIGTNLQVMDAQAMLFQAESNLWAARYDYQIGKAKINKAVGTAVLKL
jgi:outer membrane protein TolC